MASQLASDAAPEMKAPVVDTDKVPVVDPAPVIQPLERQSSATNGQIRSRLTSAKEKVEEPTEPVKASVASDARPPSAQPVPSSRPPSARPPSAVKHEQTTTADDSQVARPPSALKRQSSSLPAVDPPSTACVDTPPAHD